MASQPKDWGSKVLWNNGTQQQPYKVSQTKEEGSKVLWNTGILPQHSMTSQPEDGGNNIVQNIGILPQHYTLSQTRRPNNQCFFSNYILQRFETILHVTSDIWKGVWYDPAPVSVCSYWHMIHTNTKNGKQVLAYHMCRAKALFQSKFSQTLTVPSVPVKRGMPATSISNLILSLLIYESACTSCQLANCRCTSCFAAGLPPSCASRKDV